MSDPKMYPRKLVCPECSYIDNVQVGNSPGLPFKEDTWTWKNEGKEPFRCTPQGVAKCDHCHKEFYFRLEMVPAIRVFRMTETSDPLAEPEAGTPTDEEQSADIKQQLRKLIQEHPEEYGEVLEDLKEGR